MQEVQAALQRARDAADIAASAEAQRNAQLQESAHQESAQLHQRLDKVCPHVSAATLQSRLLLTVSTHVMHPLCCNAG